jgi:hypothetical protein
MASSRFRLGKNAAVLGGAVLVAAGLDFVFVQHTLRWCDVGDEKWLLLTKDTAALESDAKFRVRRGQIYVQRRHLGSLCALDRRLVCCAALDRDYVDNGPFEALLIPPRRCVAIPVGGTLMMSEAPPIGTKDERLVTEEDCVWQGTLSEVAVARLWPAPVSLVAVPAASGDAAAWWWRFVDPWVTRNPRIEAARSCVSSSRLSQSPPDVWRAESRRYLDDEQHWGSE